VERWSNHSPGFGVGAGEVEIGTRFGTIEQVHQP
jgi:hypothetical protein